MIISYLAFGNNIEIYCQTVFSIQSIVAQSATTDQLNFHITTDHPEYFERLVRHIHLVIHRIDESDIMSWSQVNERVTYRYRLKLKMLEMILSLYPTEPLLFLDADTFAYKSLQPLFEKLQNGYAIMHEDEGLYAQPKTKTAQAVWRNLGNIDFEGIAIDKNTLAWNSGVIGIPVQQNKESIHQAICVCDKMCILTKRNNFVEQIALSLVLASFYTIKPAKAQIGHYWGNKEEWNMHIVKTMLSATLQHYSFDQEISEIKQFDFGNIPYRIKESNTQIRLIKQVKRIFPDTNPFYVE